MIYALLKRFVDAAPDKVAVTDGRCSKTYGELDAEVLSSASFIRARFPQSVAHPHKRVLALCMDNSAAMLSTLFAASLSDLQLCVLDPSHGEYELLNVLSDCRPALIITDSKYAPKFVAALKRVEWQCELLVHDDSLAAKSLRWQCSDSVSQGDFLILYTSGSTGKPKGVVQTHESLTSRLTYWIKEAKLQPSDSHLCILPLSHAYGLIGVALPTLCSGGTLHLLSAEHTSPRNLLAYLTEQPITCFYGLPMTYLGMSKARSDTRVDVHRLRIAMVAAAQVDENVLTAFQARFGITPNNSYGTSETGIISYNHHREHDGLPTSIGRPIKGISSKIEGRRRVCDTEAGELLVKTAAMATGYFSLDANRPLADADGWFNTGDLVHEDCHGNLYIVGRTSQLINVAGNKFMPEEVESVIAEIQGVTDVAVVAAADAVTGQKVVAFIVRSGEVGEADIRSHCRARMAGYKVPVLIKWMQSLPKSATHKIRRSALAELLSGEAH